MNDFNHVKELLKSLSTDLKRALFESPFFIVNEADLRSFLYCKLCSRSEFQTPFLDSSGDPNFRVHTEYQRYYATGAVCGKYDIAILRKERPTYRLFETEDPSIKQTWLGFELKSHWNSNLTGVLGAFENDRPAFENLDDERRAKIPSDYGVLLHINVAKVRPTPKDDLRKIRSKMKECNYHPKVPIDLFGIHIESYCGNQEPREVSYLPNETKAKQTI